MSSWIVAATSYSTNNVPMIPFYIYYSMFGLQRVGDLAWLAGDMRARGFLLGGTAGRTTLNGEGLQHEDGHSHVLAATIPNCVSYDPTFAYEVVTIVREGMRRMYEAQEDVYYYITLMNENYQHPSLAEAGKGAEEGILKGLYLLKGGGETAKKGLRVQLVGSGTILREVIAAADLLKADFGVTADVWSATSFNELRRDGMAAERWNLLHPIETASQELGRGATRGTSGAGRGVDRLHAQLRRPDPGICPGGGTSIRRAGHGRFWPQRLSREAPEVLRGGSALRRDRGAQGARRRRSDQAGDRG